ncbi:PREDICTED: cytochrome P450 82C4-like isoform X2 [Tarenaya hassleriana]|uniref:cytochrome P450 82C4-like isoform X2 n=1 Tax=Tarenaya hassleriana TaxID=28532 RepID=UPI00053C6A8A|nr:PREDICTED: cytochrome P450 82C4-like isoform X2 [Tarenaya hassleriana]
MDLSLGSLAPIFIASLFLFSVFATLFKKQKHRKAPEPTGSWPILGHLHLLGGKNNLLYRTLGALADEYGPAFGLQLGSQKALVVSSWDVAKECLTVNDRTFASRPKTVGAKHMGYNYALFGFAPYDSYFRDMRKIVTFELLSNQRIQKLSHVRISEIEMGIKDIYNLWSKKGGSGPVLVDVKQWLEDLNLNMIVKLVAGKRYAFGDATADEADEARRCPKATARFFQLMGLFVLSDALPFLGRFDLQGHEKEMKKNAAEIDGILEGWLQEHERRRALGKTDGDSDFIDVMLSQKEQGKLSNLKHDERTAIKATCLAMILGGSDTLVGTLVWAFALLANNREILKKAREEIDFHVGKDRKVEDSDIEKLVYLQAITKETLRLYPAAPLLGPREATEDCTVAGYQVTAGTRLMVNVWKVHRDPKIWSNPDEFIPERFLEGKASEYSVRGQSYELLPFGSGRRSCPGISLAVQVLHLLLARFLHSFDMSTVSGMDVDMGESPGLTIPKTKPLEVLLSPRLKKELYDC